MESKEQKLEKIKKFYTPERTKKEIAELSGYNVNVVSKLLDEFGLRKIKPAKNNIKGHEQEIIDLYLQGMSQKDIAVKFNTYNTSVRRVLLRNGIKTRSTSEVLRKCKINPFKDNDQISDYFLGLLLTDGTISNRVNDKRNNQIILSLNERDKYIVEYFRDWASPETKVSKVLQKLNNSYMYSCCITNPEAEKWLKTQGNFINKSYECELYKELNYDILLGIFDGDGGFHKTNNSLQFFICGASKIFIDQIHKFLINEGFTAYVHEHTRDSSTLFYYVEIYKQNDVIKLGKLLYKNALIYCKRKYEKWLSFYESKK